MEFCWHCSILRKLCISHIYIHIYIHNLTQVQNNSLERFEKEHIEILAGCLHKPIEDKDSKTWLNIYNKLKDYIFLAMCDKDLCQLASEILKKLFTFDLI